MGSRKKFKIKTQSLLSVLSKTTVIIYFMRIMNLKEPRITFCIIKQVKVDRFRSMRLIPFRHLSDAYDLSFLGAKTCEPFANNTAFGFCT
jgi:hypothetical protein